MVVCSRREFRVELRPSVLHPSSSASGKIEANEERERLFLFYRRGAESAEILEGFIVLSDKIGGWKSFYLGCIKNHLSYT
jgi:hypothetical protein